MKKYILHTFISSSNFLLCSLYIPVIWLHSLVLPGISPLLNSEDRRQSTLCRWGDSMRLIGFLVSDQLPEFHNNETYQIFCYYELHQAVQEILLWVLKLLKTSLPRPKPFHNFNSILCSNLNIELLAFIYPFIKMLVIEVLPEVADTSFPPIMC